MLSPTSLVLVCLLPTPRDLEIARLLGWYRIPLRSAPKVVAVDALAFYQPASFGEAAGLLVFEEEGHARRRGAKLRARFLGYGVTSDAHHMTQPEPTGEAGARTLAACLKAAGLNPKPFILDTLAEAYFVNGMHREAIEAIDLAIAGEEGDKSQYLKQKQKFEQALRALRST